MSGKIVNYCKGDKTSGLMFSGSIYLAVDIGIGSEPEGAVQSGTFASGPRAGQTYYKDVATGRFASGVERRKQVVLLRCRVSYRNARQNLM